MTEGIFAVLYVSIMGLTRFVKRQFFAFIFAVFLLNVNDRHVGVLFYFPFEFDFPLVTGIFVCEGETASPC